MRPIGHWEGKIVVFKGLVSRVEQYRDTYNVMLTDVWMKRYAVPCEPVWIDHVWVSSCQSTTPGIQIELMGIVRRYTRANNTRDYTLKPAGMDCVKAVETYQAMQIKGESPETKLRVLYAIRHAMQNRHDFWGYDCDDRDRDFCRRMCEENIRVHEGEIESRKRAPAPRPRPTLGGLRIKGRERVKAKGFG